MFCFGSMFFWLSKSISKRSITKGFEEAFPMKQIWNDRGMKRRGLDVSSCRPTMQWRIHLATCSYIKPWGNESISHLGNFGKLSTKKVPWGKGYVSSREGTPILLNALTWAETSTMSLSRMLQQFNSYAMYISTPLYSYLTFVLFV